MENFNIQVDYDSLNLTFLQGRISQLRLQKGSYISEDFAQTLDSTYRALSLAIHKNFKSLLRFASPTLEPISDHMVDCCLRCMEEILQNLITAQYQPNKHQEKQEIPQIFDGLKDIAQDLYSLTFYIRYSIDPKKFLAEQIELYKKAGLNVSNEAVF
jgi:hypothetical protein